MKSEEREKYEETRRDDRKKSEDAEKRKEQRQQNAIAGWRRTGERRDEKIKARKGDEAVEEMRDDTPLNTRSLASSCTPGSRWHGVALCVGGNGVGCLSSKIA